MNFSADLSTRFILLLLSLAVISAGCSAPVPLPKYIAAKPCLQDKNAGDTQLVRGNPGVILTRKKKISCLDRAALEQELIKNPPRSTEPINKFIPYPEGWIPREGDTTPYGSELSGPWIRSLRLYRLGNGTEALENLDAAQELSTSAGAHWEQAILRLKILIMMGRATDALDLVDEAGRLEKEFLGVNRIVLSFEGSIHFHLGDFSPARQTVAAYLHSLDNWQFPTSFPRPPSNKAALQAVTWGKLRSMTIFALSLVSEGRIEDALPWLLETEQEYRRLHQFGNHPFYSHFAKITSEGIYGRAMNQAFLGAAYLELNAPHGLVKQAFSHALTGFEVLGYKPGKLYVAALKARALTRA